VTSKIVENVLDLPNKRRKRRKAKAETKADQVKAILANLRAALEERNVDEAIKELNTLEIALLKA
jgi:hypothetical protein